MENENITNINYNTDLLSELLQKTNVCEIIDHSSDRCYITLLGKDENDKKFVIVLKKTEFPNQSSFYTIDNIKNTFKNDIYHKYICEDKINSQVNNKYISNYIGCNRFYLSM
jgi:hypothetical protein